MAKDANTNSENSSSQSSSSGKRRSILPLIGSSVAPESASDPLRILRDIAADDNIDDNTRVWLFEFAVTRFNNRRKMAYISLLTIIGFLVFLVLAAVYDGVGTCQVLQAGEVCKGILSSVKEVENLLTWIGGFLATIVATYYGVSSFRPSS